MASDRIVLKIFDEDKVTDEIVGSMYFSLKNIINKIGENGEFLCRNVYGSPLGVMGESTN